MKAARGFTLIELLVVIAIIGILASVILVSLNSARDKARMASVRQQEQEVYTAVEAARINTGLALKDITGSTYSANPCKYIKMNNIPETSPCYAGELAAFSKINVASGGMLNGFLKNIRDPWGSPYMLDENEGEYGVCRHDNLISAGPDGLLNVNGSTSADDIVWDIPFGTTACASPS